MTTQEDLAAENILKRAELARISRQLKSRLSKTNLKIKNSPIKKSPTKLSSYTIVPSISAAKLKQPQSQNETQPQSQASQQLPLRQHQPSLMKRRSVESIDLNKTEDEFEEDSSPVKRQGHRQQMPPSSPIYEEFAIPLNPPSTPPQQKIQLNTDIYNTNSTNKTFIQSSSPAQQRSAQKIPSTPKNSHDEGADLLMFLATSPSPVQYKNVPSTPSNRPLNPKFHSRFNPDSALAQVSATPGTPMRNLMKTPGFNMNDYVNLFTPSPGRISKTPDLGGKDVSGKLIRF